MGFSGRGEHPAQGHHGIPSRAIRHEVLDGAIDLVTGTTLPANASIDAFVASVTP